MNRHAMNKAAMPSFGIVILLLCVAVPTLPADGPNKAVETYPRQVLIIRHAEKPAGGDDVHLTEQGERRARALPALFEKTADRPEPFPKPDLVFAARDSEQSHRCVETAKPLARKLGLPLDDNFKNHAFAELARELFSNERYRGKTVLVCWHHGTIPDLARALHATDAPAEWDHKAFDRVWVLAYDGKGKVTFADRPQQLMSGDSKK